MGEWWMDVGGGEAGAGMRSDARRWTDAEQREGAALDHSASPSTHTLREDQ